MQFIVLFISFISVVFLARDSGAVTVTAAPNPALVNQNVTFTIASAFAAAPGPGCQFELNFGDGSAFGLVSPGACSTVAGTTRCNAALNHSYAAAGSYTVSEIAVGCAAAPIAPEPAPVITVTVQCPLFNGLASTALPNARIGQAYSFQLTGSGGRSPYRFSLAPATGPLPAGLSLNSGGNISGIPTTAGSFSFNVVITDSCNPAQSRTQLLTLTVDPCPPLSIAPAALPSGTVGLAYAQNISYSGGQGAVTLSLVGALPPGLSFSGTAITGSPTATGNYPFAINASDSCPAGAQNLRQNYAVQIQPAAAVLSVNASPSSLSIVTGQSSSNTVLYQFSGGSGPVTLQSPSGSFLVAADTVGVNQLPLSVNIAAGRGQVVETVVVPAAVIDRALQRGVNRFTYERTFSSGGATVHSVVSYTITTEAAASFDIRGMELYFENRRPEITVERNRPDLKAYADIRFVGSGLLQGFWEVDGRMLGMVNQTLTYGSVITVQTTLPVLPTFDPGAHIVRFIITNPVTSIPLPSVLYYVNEEEGRAGAFDLILTAPNDGAVVAGTNARFEWRKFSKATLHLVQYFSAPDSKPVFSAYTRDNGYTLPKVVADTIFSTGVKYYWMVTGFDAESNMRGRSMLRSFSLSGVEKK